MYKYQIFCSFVRTYAYKAQAHMDTLKKTYCKVFATLII